MDRRRIVSLQRQPSVSSLAIRTGQVRNLTLYSDPYPDDPLQASVMFHDRINKNRKLLGGWQSQTFSVAYNTNPTVVPQRI